VLTEAEVHRSFRRLFGSGEINQEAIERAEQLIDLLRVESPLRLRLSEELDELRQLVVSDT
jgi:hypothetical protein